MKLRPLVLAKLDLRLPGIRVKQLRLNRHLEETAPGRMHRHPHAQLLLYLAGSGSQRLPAEVWPVRAGTLLFVPPRLPHAFDETAVRRPLCLVLDLELRGAAAKSVRRAAMTHDELGEVRHILATLAADIARGEAGVAPRPSADAPGDSPPRRGLLRASPAVDPMARRIRTGRRVLALLEILLRRLGWLDSQAVHEEEAPPILRRVRQAMTSPDPAQGRTLSDVARRTGYHRDHLNRLLKRATGLTVGQLRSREKLAQAKALLTGPESIGVIAERLGFGDQNYFARWFRRQEGMAPTQWRGMGSKRERTAR